MEDTIKKKAPAKRATKKTTPATTVKTKSGNNKTSRSRFDKNEELQKEATKKSHSPEAEAKRNVTRAIKKEAKQALQGVLLDCVHNELLAPSPVDKTPYLHRFVKSFFNQALEDIESKPAQMLASIIFTSDLIKDIDNEREKLMTQDIDFLRYRIAKHLFRQQLDVINDRISKFICLLCSRRAGKTVDNTHIMVDRALQPNTEICYIHLTFQNGIDQTFDMVRDICDEIGLVYTKLDKTKGVIEFANGSVIRFRGNANKQETEKVRGFKYRLVIIDEAQSQRNLKYLVEDVVQPLLLDYADSQLILSGTPPRIPRTYFEDAYIGNEYKSYHWDMRDNPHIPNVNQALEDICKRKGVTMDNPLIQREYLGLIVYDKEALMFKGYKTYKEIVSNFVPDKIYIGVDFGFSDNNAVVTLAADLEQKRAYVIRETKFNKATVNDIITDIRTAYDEATAYIMQHNSRVEMSGAVTIYADTNEQSISYTLSTTYNLPTYNAYKYNKMLALEQLAEYFRTERILFKEGGPLADEAERTVKKRDEQSDAILNELDDAIFHPDAMFALLYASRQFFFDIGAEAGGESTNLNDNYQ